MLACYTFISVVLMSTCHFGPQSAACSDLIAGSCRNIHHRADIPDQRISTHRAVGDHIDGAFSVLTIPLSFFSNLFLVQRFTSHDSVFTSLVFHLYDRDHRALD